MLLLQVAPSKQDRERVLPICPELAHALARIIERARGNPPSIPCIPRYDPLERTISAPLPYLFQGGPKRQRGVYSREYIRQLLRNASLELALRDKQGESIVFRSHDFRRLFATEAVNSGLPIHIAAKLLGHTDLNTTRGYVAVYEDEVVRHYQTHLARRRAFRPPHDIANLAMPSGRSSRSTFVADRWHWANAIGRTALTARTNMHVCAAQCYAWMLGSCHASCRLRKIRTAY